MNIQSITSIVPRFKASETSANNQGQLLTNFGLKMDEPIKQDTVSFKAGAHASKTTKKAVNILQLMVKNADVAVKEESGPTNKVAEKSMEINNTTAKAIHNRMLMSAQKVFKFMEDTFGDLVADAKNPNNPILEIAYRLKSVGSLKEKTGSRKWSSVDEVLQNMTDLIGTKLVLRDSDKKTVDGILDRMIPLIKSRTIELVEIENKRPKAVKGLAERDASKYDYASVSMLKKMADIQNGVWKKGGSKERVNANLDHDFTPANYCAIHFLFRIPGKRAATFEMQVMGDNTNKAKHLDDLVYKKLDGKNPANCPEKFHELFEPLANPKFFAQEGETRAKEIVKNAKEKFNKYRGEMFLFQRMKADMPYTKKSAKKKEQFLPIQYQLFPSDIELKYGISSLDFDYNNIAKLVERGQRKASKNK